VLAGIFNLIPYIGPLLATVAPILVSLSMGMDPSMLLAAVSVILVGQLIDNLVVVPTVLARAANLHPLMALLAIIVAGNLFGLAGMVFALPVLASVRIIFVGVYEELARAA
jgi:predicted PurR-regulated permease PerM